MAHFRMLGLGAGVKQPVYLFPGGKDLGIQQGMSVWVGLPKFWARMMDVPPMKFT